MLDYAFPYTDPATGSAYAAAASALKAALQAPDGAAFTASKMQYLAARNRLQRTVSDADWRYFEFQLWQEGVARWTEIELGHRHPDDTIRAEAAASGRRVLTDLTGSDLAARQRLAVYDFGAAEAMLLERIDPRWRETYPRTLALGDLFK